MDHLEEMDLPVEWNLDARKHHHNSWWIKVVMVVMVVVDLKYNTCTIAMVGGGAGAAGH